MTLPRTLICLAVIAVVTLAANFVMSKYQTDLKNSAMEYAELMVGIPTEFGVWKRTKTAELPWYAVEQLKVVHAEHWTYVNEQTQEQVHVSFLIGPTGRLSVHTPEVCMTGEGYGVIRERERESFSATPVRVSSNEANKNDAQDTFWRVAIGNRTLGDFQIVAYYSLGTGKRWWAKDNPRYELAKYPFVLKMQVDTIEDTVVDSDAEEYNAARAFLEAFLPEVAAVFAETDLEGKYGR